MPSSKIDCSHQIYWGEDIVVSVLILNWNGSEYLSDCVATVVRQACIHVEVIVVDNGSTDGSDMMVRTKWPDVRVVRHLTNLGFVMGYNRAVPQARGAVLVFLNNDTLVADGWLNELVDTVVSDASVGIACSKLVFVNSSIVNSMGGQLKLWTGGQEIGFGKGEALFSGQRSLNPFYASGASMAMRRETFDQLEGFDPGIFAYGEDLDISWRARLRGYRILCLTESIAYHHGSTTMGVFNPEKVRMVTYGQIRAMVKCLSGPHLIHSLPAYVVFSLIKGFGLSILKRDLHYLQAVFAALFATARNLPGLLEARKRTQATRLGRDSVVLDSLGFGLASTPMEMWQVIRTALAYPRVRPASPPNSFATASGPPDRTTETAP